MLVSSFRRKETCFRDIALCRRSAVRLSMTVIEDGPKMCRGIMREYVDANTLLLRSSWVAYSRSTSLQALNTDRSRQLHGYPLRTLSQKSRVWVERRG